MKTQTFKYLQIYCIILFAFSCSHGPVKTKKEALIKITKKTVFTDQLSFLSLKESIENTIEKLKLKNDSSIISYPVEFSMEEYVYFLSLLNKCATDVESFSMYTNKFFDPYMTFGKEDYGEILLTSYYEPLIKGSLTKTSHLSMPLYKSPPNLVEVKLGQFSEALYGPIDTSRKVISAQLSTDRFGNKIITPLPSRGAIDFEGALSNKNLEIAYVDPIEAFFLHIQGSGRILLPGGKSFTVGYHAQNGMKYEPIGKFLKDDIPKEKNESPKY